MRLGSFAARWHRPHYLKQFLPKYVGQDKVDEMTKAAGFDNWVNFFKYQRELAATTPICRCSAAWKTTTPINTPTWTLERNPFFYAVDTEGNQLPYFDKIQMTLAENLEVLNLRAIAGEYDSQERHIDLGKLPVFLENQQKGNYTVQLDPVRQRLGRHDPDQPELHRPIPRSRSGCGTGTSATPSRSASTATSSTRCSGSASGTPGSVVPDESSPSNPGPSGGRSGPCSTSSRRTSCWTRSG